MMATNVAQGNALRLPKALGTAQAAIHLPEVQAMLRRLSEFELGIFMPHMHGEQTGEFLPLPDNVTQVESGLTVSFRPTGDIASHSDRFLPVGWTWRSGAATPCAVCDMDSDQSPGDRGSYVKHKMPDGD